MIDGLAGWLASRFIEKVPREGDQSRPLLETRFLKVILFANKFDDFQFNFCLNSFIPLTVIRLI